uniref:Sphingomyelin phosphodiesterase n=1 Tax=Aceria tosichella TaxID=561515 RepID=A0A6G1S708_9ACAR
MRRPLPVRMSSGSHLGLGTTKLSAVLLLVTLSLLVQSGLTAQDPAMSQQLQQARMELANRIQQEANRPTSPASPASSAQQQQKQQPEQSFFSLKSFFTGQSRPAFSDRKCLMCRFSVSLVNYALKTKRGYDQIDKIANTFCTAAHLESAMVCSQVSKLFNHEITKVLAYGVLTPNQVCGILSNNTCGHFHSPLDDWEIHLDASHHLNQIELARIKADNKKTRETPVGGATATSGNVPYRVVHISDTHIDTKYKPGAPVRCQEPLCCQASSTPLNTTSDSSATTSAAGHWGSYGQCDIPMWTFEATLKFIESIIKDAKDIEYIIWTGDIQPHDVWTQNKKSALQLYDTVFARIFKYLPKVKILPTLGNHEMVPVDSFSPSNLYDIARDDSPVWLYKKLDSFWSRWLPKDTINTITKDGFYATQLRPGLKVVSLNTNFCHSKNFWLFINSTDPGNQLQWLVHELQMSELSDEKVHIIGHIPPGSEDCMKVWSKNYNRILRRFAQTITGQFFGHTHYNEFEMFYDQEDPTTSVSSSNSAPREHTNEVSSSSSASANNNANAKPQQVVTSLAVLNTTSMANNNNSIIAANLSNSLLAAASTSTKSVNLKPIGVGFIGPSVTTFINLNPSFRIYNIDPARGFMPTDFETYFMNLTTANANTTHEPEWTSSGKFTETFGLNDTSPESMHELLTDIASDFKDIDDEMADGSESDGVDANGDEAAAYDSGDASSSSSTTSSSTTSANPADGTTGVETDEEEEDDDELDSDDRLFELYWMYNSYSDTFNRSVYDQIPFEDKRGFLCRLFTGQSHDPLACEEFLPMVTLYKVAKDLI